ncbi:hypothetical protein M407DRAFT_97721 [Tulasnella calospora MUT 4182]|uniref:BTB domain-containing protein n=1 Tax=Tulasnella calospora MUT 4182 TaxID=1051891 RepID=A0A0C3QFG9_9AGAM|nr:hypothetical protein M407DRAFT_97721 [Tulasnella calospora MUT 4182]
MAETKFIVQHPFDAESSGDCVLRACDGTEFKVSRAILSFASSIFRDMFSLPPAAGGGKDQNDISVIPVGEDASTLQVLLQMIYPVDPPSITSFQLVQKLVAACDKYFISPAKLRLHLRDALNDDQFIKEDPLACYALLWKLGWEEEAIKASRFTHTLELTESSIGKKLVEQSGDMEALFQLLRLKDSREEALDGLLSLVTDITQYPCRAEGRHALSVIVNLDYTERRVGLKQKLKEPYPDAQDVENFLGFTVTASAACVMCRELRAARLHTIRVKVIEALTGYPQAISGLPSRK